MIFKKYETLLENLFEGAYVVDSKRKIVYWNKGAEEITGYSKDEVLEFHCYNNILKHITSDGTELCFSGCPLHNTLQTGDISTGDVFLSHKQGYRVPVSVKAFPIYADDDTSIIGSVEIFTDRRFRESHFVENKRLQELVITDELTGIYNRRYLEYQFKNFISESREFEQAFGILFFDIDLFKNVNDIYGHNVGDEVLKVVASTVHSNIRGKDIFGRWGGEEFILLSHIKSKKALLNLADKLRTLIEKSNYKIKDKEWIKVTASIGGAMFENDSNMKDLIKKADENMYISKQTGRNKSTIT